MTVWLLILLVFVQPLQPRLGKGCQCINAKRTETTNWGHIANGYIERSTYRRIEGVVVDYSDEPMDGVLIEVYDHPEFNPALQRDGAGGKGEQRRISGCKTRPDGKFCFRGIGPGKYDLRASKTNFNSTSIMLTIRQKGRGTSKNITVRLQVGT